MLKHNTQQATSDRLEEAVNRLTQGQTTLAQNHSSLSHAHSVINSKIDTIMEQLPALAITPSPKSPPSPPPPPSSIHCPNMKLDIPWFDGQDSLGWIFKISQFFDFHYVPNTKRLTVASFYMEGPTMYWYQWMSRNDFLSSWLAMLQTLESRFAPSYYDDLHGALFKLQKRVLSMIIWRILGS